MTTIQIKTISDLRGTGLRTPDATARAAPFDATAEGLVAWLRAAEPRGAWTADQLWELYAAHFADFAAQCERALTRGQLFQRLRHAGVRRRRSGAKGRDGRRTYFYSLSRAEDLKRHRGRIVAARPRNVHGSGPAHGRFGGS